MIVYVNVKDNKVEITRDQLEKLLKEEYDKGYSDGTLNNNQISLFNSCPFGGSWNCPYKSNTPNNPQYPSITWTCDITTEKE